MPIGLDFGSAGVKMLQLTPTDSGFRVQAGGQYELPAELPLEGPERQAALIEAVRQIRESSPFAGRDVVVGLPETAMQFKSVRMPKMPPDELARAVAWEAADRFESSQGLTVRHICAGEVHQGDETRQEVILMAAAESAINGCMDVLAACGMRPAACEPSPIALARSFARHYRREADQQVARVVIDLGASSTKVMIMRGHHVCFYRRLELGGAAMNRAVAAKLNITPTEAAALRRQLGAEADPARATAVSDALRAVLADIAREIGLCLRYYSVTFRGNRPEHIHVCGGEAHLPLVAGVFEKELGSGVEIAEPLDGLDLADPSVRIERRGKLSEWAVAAGLALRAPHVAMRGAA